MDNIYEKGLRIYWAIQIQVSQEVVLLSYHIDIDLNPPQTLLD